MKRFLLTLTLAVAILGAMFCNVPKDMRYEIPDYKNYDAAVYVYCRRTTADGVNLGFGCEVVCPFAEYKTALSNCEDVDGLSVRFEGTADDVERIVKRLRAKQVSVQQFEDLSVACYFSPLICQRVILDGQFVNVQIACSNGTVTVGYPLILGSY